MPHKAKFRPIQLKDGSAWYVLYSPDKGPSEHIEGFYTEEDALEWIELESTSWLAKKKTRYVKLGGASVPRHLHARRHVAQTFMRMRTLCGVLLMCMAGLRRGHARVKSALSIVSQLPSQRIS